MNAFGIHTCYDFLYIKSWYFSKYFTVIKIFVPLKINGKLFLPPGTAIKATNKYSSGEQCNKQIPTADSQHIITFYVIK